MIIKNKLTREILDIPYSEFRKKFVKELQDAFETMEKIDDMVGKLQRTYQAYSGQIDDFFDVVSELKGYVETFKSLLGSLPKIQLPF